MRLITLRSATLARLERISSCTPSVKKAVSWFALKFSNGRTAMLFSGIEAATAEVVARDTSFDSVRKVWKKIQADYRQSLGRPEL